MERKKEWRRKRKIQIKRREEIWPEKSSSRLLT
jgi:hypothetical protein